MQSIQIEQYVEEDGILTLKLPPELKQKKVKFFIIFETIQEENLTLEQDDSGWSPGFFERTAGAWAGEPFVRPDQGNYPEREEFL